jgi:hypothetical protein
MLSGADDLAIGSATANQQISEGTDPSNNKKVEAPKPTDEMAPSVDEDGEDGNGGDAGTGGSSGQVLMPKDNFVECGAITCHGETAACCVGSQGATKDCFEQGGACGGAVIECGGRENCGSGEVCCLRLGGPTPPHASCTVAASCTGSVWQFCRTVADCNPGQICATTTGAFSEHKACLSPP